ncbi:MAG: Flp pilus assembly complex ATPase component TadA [Magnetococcales bacterium]|nr:Flp pilus assembly complex ATPase component TadA [Magnetococcales bacterium]
MTRTTPEKKTLEKHDLWKALTEPADGQHQENKQAPCWTDEDLEKARSVYQDFLDSEYGTWARLIHWVAGLFNSNKKKFLFEPRHTLFWILHKYARGIITQARGDRDIRATEAASRAVKLIEALCAEASKLTGIALVFKETDYQNLALRMDKNPPAWLPLADAKEKGGVLLNTPNPDKLLELVVWDPCNVELPDYVARCSGKPVHVVMSHPDALFRAMRRHADQTEVSIQDEGVGIYTIGQEIAVPILDEFSTVAIGDLNSARRDLDHIFKRALELKVSDIHFEPNNQGRLVRGRRNGIMEELDGFHHDRWPYSIAMLKLVSRMDVAKRQIFQDGRFTLVQPQDKIRVDVRVSAVPVQGGEKMVLRLLDPERIDLPLDELGLRGEVQSTLLNAIKYPQGMILLSGPTGSGKTTTLYSLLKLLNDGTRNLVTVEDPVEIHMEGVQQISVNPRMNRTFANSLRAILRQDPDVIMIGEIRDPETAAIAVQSALTGHLVLSTIHANNAKDVITRLGNMGISAFDLYNSLTLTAAQRLVRTLCDTPGCSRNTTEADIIKLKNHRILSKLSPDSAALLPYKEAVSNNRECKRCRGTGYTGRTALFEYFMPDQAFHTRVQERILSGSFELGQLYQCIDMNHETLLTQAELRLQKGETTVSELLRVW